MKECETEVSLVWETRIIDVLRAEADKLGISVSSFIKVVVVGSLLDKENGVMIEAVYGNDDDNGDGGEPIPHRFNN